jgi:hypothetical protein
MNTAEFIRDKVVGYVQSCPPEWTFTPKELGVLNGHLNRAIKTPMGDYKQAAAFRRMVLAWLFKPGVTAISSKELTRQQVYALEQWIGAWYNEIEGRWETSIEFSVEAAAVLVQALSDQAERDVLFSVKSEADDVA